MLKISIKKLKTKHCIGTSMSEFRRKMLAFKKEGYSPVGNIIKQNIDGELIVCQIITLLLIKLVKTKKKK